MAGIDVIIPLDGQLAELRRLVAMARGLCYTRRPEEDPPMVPRHEAAPAPTDTTPCAVQLKRADGLEVQVSGPAGFVKTMLEDVLEILGVIQPPAA